ncbi:hypothetical protein B296_00046915 [Ensete ventricosum]|uniref:Uncharacterized protein n=1 Tax=Ensete ventricosum TaxID=4639 RepID=A0A426Y855_ENSVE|nr:hypothetical protein B296_00046915 [Ensete ventricosum]
MKAIVTSAKDTDDIKGQEAEKEEQQGKKAQSVIAGGDLNAVDKMSLGSDPATCGSHTPHPLLITPTQSPFTRKKRERKNKRQQQLNKSANQRKTACKLRGERPHSHRSPSVTDIVSLLVGPTEGGATWFDWPAQTPFLHMTQVGPMSRTCDLT